MESRWSLQADMQHGAKGEFFVSRPGIASVPRGLVRQMKPTEMPFYQTQAPFGHGCLVLPQGTWTSLHIV